MERQVKGEALDLGDVLTWAPGFYYQSQFFTGHVREGDMHAEHEHATHGPSAASAGMLRYDIETSGFPSSHCGHLVLLRLKEDIYPASRTLDDWPSWNVPIMRWAKRQGAIVGYAHSAGGLTVDSTALPNYLMPRFDSSGANEFIADVTEPGLVDFIAGCDLWPFAELNIWYHTLNCGFRTTFAGETDFPCISDERVGRGRSYVSLASAPRGDAGYDAWVQGLRESATYAGDGRSHIFNFAVTGAGKTQRVREVTLPHSGAVHVSAVVVARLEPEITESTEKIRKASPYDTPYWHLERARVGPTRKVPVELLVNGVAVQKTEVVADGNPITVGFDQLIEKSSWVALRIYPSSHTNPVFVVVNGKPVRASKKSAQWCYDAVDVCWKQKEQRIRKGELEEARAFFDRARNIYRTILDES